MAAVVPGITEEERPSLLLCFPGSQEILPEDPWLSPFHWPKLVTCPILSQSLWRGGSDDWVRLKMESCGRKAECVSLNVYYSLKAHDCRSPVELFTLEIQVSLFFCVKRDRANSLNTADSEQLHLKLSEPTPFPATDRPLTQPLAGI